jgi:hypothetical protein
MSVDELEVDKLSVYELLVDELSVYDLPWYHLHIMFLS